MPRVARMVIPGVPHHVTQRGNNRAEVFFDEEDPMVYLSLLRHYRKKHNCDVFAYCLMPNHVHLIVTPWQSDSLARMLSGTHMRYAQHLNEKYSKSGHAWQNRFCSCPLDDAHALAATRYVELNPVRAGIAAQASMYAWSSAKAHAGRVMDETGVLSDSWPPRDVLERWQSLLAVEDRKGEDALRQATRRGRPLGCAEFILKLERLTGLNLQIRERGRPGSREKLGQ